MYDKTRRPQISTDQHGSGEVIHNLGRQRPRIKRCFESAGALLTVPHPRLPRDPRLLEFIRVNSCESLAEFVIYFWNFISTVTCTGTGLPSFLAGENFQVLTV